MKTKLSVSFAFALCLVSGSASAAVPASSEMNSAIAEVRSATQALSRAIETRRGSCKSETDAEDRATCEGAVDTLKLMLGEAQKDPAFSGKTAEQLQQEAIQIRRTLRDMNSSG